MWVGGLLAEFPNMPSEAQAVVTNFFGLSENKAKKSRIFAILRAKGGPVDESQFANDDDDDETWTSSVLTLPPTVIGILQVSVAAGGMVAKSDNDKSLHYSYRTEIKVLGSRPDQCFTHFVESAFDGYRSFNEALLKFIPTPIGEFPRSYPRSKLGLSLSKPQFEERLTCLNRWMGTVLTCFPSMPQAAKMVVEDFLELDAQSTDRNIQIILAVLEENQNDAVAADEDRDTVDDISVDSASQSGGAEVAIRQILSKKLPVVVIRDWLAVQVTLGEPMLKTSADRWKHHTYEVRLPATCLAVFCFVFFHRFWFRRTQI